jgi:hypothetical protein
MIGGATAARARQGLPHLRTLPAVMHAAQQKGRIAPAFRPRGQDHFRHYTLPDR